MTDEAAGPTHNLVGRLTQLRQGRCTRLIIHFPSNWDLPWSYLGALLERRRPI